jgi:hypothetical protein
MASPKIGMDIRQLNRKLEKLKKQTPTIEMKSLSVVGSQAVKDCRSVQQSLAGANPNYTGTKSSPVKSLQGMTRWGFTTQRGTGVKSIRIGIFAGKSQGGSVISNKYWKSRHNATVNKWGKLMTFGGKLRMPAWNKTNPGPRGQFIRTAAASKGRLQFIKKSTTYIHFTPIPWTSVFHTHASKWKMIAGKEFKKRVRRVYLGGRA